MNGELHQCKALKRAKKSDELLKILEMKVVIVDGFCLFVCLFLARNHFMSKEKLTIDEGI